LIAQHLGDFRANLYAPTTYPDKAGRPLTARMLADHDFVGSPNSDQFVTLLRDKGIPVRRESFVMSSESGVVQWELVKAGYGVTIMPERLEETTQKIERVLPDLPSLEFPIWLVTHRELKTSRRIRVVFDLLARELATTVRTKL
jgi:DNA-binding transcriptional LysR family regulator